MRDSAAAAGARALDFQVESSRDDARVTGRERSIADCLMFLEYSGGAEELDRSLAMFPSFDFEAALEYLKLLRMPWLYARLGFLLDRHAEKLFFRGKQRDLFLRKLPKGVAYLGRRRSAVQIRAPRPNPYNSADYRSQILALLHCGATWEQQEKFPNLTDVETWPKPMQTLNNGSGRLRVRQAPPSSGAAAS